MSIIKIKISEIIIKDRMATPINKSSEDFKKIKQSIENLGIIRPIHVSGKFIKENNNIQYTLLDGLSRVEAAKDLGISEISAFVDITH